MINLPVNVDKARLPAAYKHAKASLAKCEKIDECKTWADKAAALASYAKQAKDDTLAKHCRRIQSRAIRRAGELLKAIEPRVASKLGDKLAGTRTKVAKAAGLSAMQQKNAYSVASIPESEFEAAVESNKPPTISELAERGKKKRAPKPAPEIEGTVEDDLDETPENFRTAFLLRADTARDFAVYTGPISEDIVKAARATALAWNKLARNLKEKL